MNNPIPLRTAVRDGVHYMPVYLDREVALAILEQREAEIDELQYKELTQMTYRPPASKQYYPLSTRIIYRQPNTVDYHIAERGQRGRPIALCGAVMTSNKRQAYTSAPTDKVCECCIEAAMRLAREHS